MNWVSVKERLPESGTEVLAIHVAEGWIRISRYSAYNPIWSGFEPTHWMPLPEFPEHEDLSS